MNSKKFNRILLVAVFAIILSAVLLLVGCGVQVNQVYIKNDEKPQLVFVQGEELDLSGGKLTVETEKETLSLDLTSPEVSVTGYDKNTLGQQTLTVTYGDKSTTLKVTVVRRMVFEGCTVNYFVNESFDKAKGNI